MLDEQRVGSSGIAPKNAFFAGLGTGVLGMGTLGFIFLFANLLQGGTLNLGGSLRANNPSPSVGTNNAGGTDTGGTEPSTPPPAVTDRDHIRGNANAKITLIEYSDFECPFCKQFAPTTDQVLANYKDKVRLVYRHFPLSFHQNAQKQAEASECVADLGGNDAFWKFHDLLFARTTSGGTGFALNALGPLAKEIGVDQAKFQDCLDTGKYAPYVLDQMNAGSAAGVSGTPGTFVIAADGGAQLIPGALPFESIKQMIDSVL